MNDTELNDLETVAKVLSELAATADFVDSLLVTEGDAFELHLTDGRGVVVEFERDYGRLMFSIDIGSPPAARRADVNATLMAYNSLWRETGGLRAAAATPDAPFTLMIDVFFYNLTAEFLLRLLRSLLEKADLFTAYIDAPTEAQSFDPASAESFIRV